MKSLVRRLPWGCILRFGLVGVANTAFYYACYRLFLWWWQAYLPAHWAGFALSVIFSFFANCLFTYRVKPTWRRFIEFPASTLTNLVISTVGSIVLVQWVQIDRRWATLLAALLAIPFTFMATTWILTRHADQTCVRHGTMDGVRSDEGA